MQTRWLGLHNIWKLISVIETSGVAKVRAVIIESGSSIDVCQCGSVSCYFCKSYKCTHNIKGPLKICRIVTEPTFFLQTLSLRRSTYIVLVKNGACFCSVLLANWRILQCVKWLFFWIDLGGPIVCTVNAEWGNLEFGWDHFGK